MKSSENNFKEIDNAFEKIFENYDNDYENEANVLASKVLSEIDTVISKKGLNRKEVASLIGTSASYITQLYRGNKLLNFITLAKLKNKLNLDIEIRVTESNYLDIKNDFSYQDLTKEVDVDGKIACWKLLYNLNSKEDDFLGVETKPNKVYDKQLIA